MLNQLESNYDCARAGDDLHQLIQELEQLKQSGNGTEDSKQMINRLENQIHFIKNKCDIH